MSECHSALAQHAFERDAFDDAEASYNAFLAVAPQHAMRDQPKPPSVIKRLQRLETALKRIERCAKSQKK